MSKLCYLLEKLFMASLTFDVYHNILLKVKFDYKIEIVRKHHCVLRNADLKVNKK